MKCRKEKTEDGQDVPVVSKDGEEYALGSLYAGTHATDVWMEQFDTDGPENMLLMGMGDCQIIDRALNVFRGKILVWEPEPAVFSCMKGSHSYRKIQGEERLSLYVGQESLGEVEREIRGILGADAVETTVLAAHPGYRVLCPEQFMQLDGICVKICDEIGFMKAPIKRFIVEMIHNQLHNVPNMRNGIPLARLKKYWDTEVPAILVSAGPSLEKNAEELKKVKGRAWICCVDIAVPTLLKRDIVPDIIVCSDAKIRMDWMADERSRDIPVLLTSNVSEELPNMSQAVKIWGVDHPFVRLLCENAGIEQPRLRAYSGVSTVLFACLMELGVRELIFIGQDLSYSEDGRSHVTGRDEGFIQDESYMLDGYYGGKVWSRGDWYVFHDWFERSIPVFPECRFINATEGGARIAGTEQIPLRRVVESLPARGGELRSVFENPLTHITEREYEDLMGGLRVCGADLREIREAGYEKAFFQSNLEKKPVMCLVLDYMKSLDDGSRRERFRKALQYVLKEWEKLEL